MVVFSGFLTSLAFMVLKLTHVIGWPWVAIVAPLVGAGAMEVAWLKLAVWADKMERRRRFEIFQKSDLYKELMKERATRR